MPTGKGYNVILLGLDMLRADHLGCYGYPRITSPAIDALASKSLVFENCFAQAPITATSFMSIMTSLYPSKHGIMDNITPTGKYYILDSKIPTWAKILKENGYVTGAFTDGGNVWSKLGFGNGFDYYSNNKSGQPPLWGRKGSIPDQEIYSWLNENQHAPFFLFFHTYAIHKPWFAPKPYWKIFDPHYNGEISLKERFPLPARRGKMGEMGSYAYFIKKISRNQRNLEYFKSIYDGAIKYADDFIENLLNELAKLRLLEKTLIIVTSDHGDQFMEHGKLGHDRFYDELLHVPLIISLSGLKHTKISQIVRSVDIMPTVFDILNIKIQHPINGISLLQTLKSDLDLLAVAEAEIYGYSARNKNYKYIYPRYQKRLKRVDELYDLKEDSAEQNNIFKENIKLGNDMIQIFNKELHRAEIPRYQSEISYIA